MAVRKIKGSWTVDFRYEYRRYRIRSPVNTESGAKQYEAELRLKLANGEQISRSGERKMNPIGSIKYAEFAALWLEEYVKSNNKPTVYISKQQTLALHLLPAFGCYRLDQITTERIERFKSKLLVKGLSAKSVNNYLSILRKCLSTAIEWGELASLPRFKLLKAQTPDFVYLTEDEANKLIEAAPQGLWRNMILMGLRTGMRISEMTGLRWEDVNLITGTICVRRSNYRGTLMKTTKTNKIRHIPITEDLKNILMKLDRNQPIVFHRNEEWVRYDTALDNLHAISKSIGIKPIGWHVLRHTFASHLVAKGAPLKAVQDLMGHTTIEMTMRYSHLSQDDLRGAINLLEQKLTNIVSPWALRGHLKLDA